MLSFIGKHQLLLKFRTRKSAETASSNNRRIQTERGEKGTKWKLLRVEIDQEPEYFGGFMQISFQAIRGSSFQSDIAIDDICIAEGPCGKQTYFVKRDIVNIKAIGVLKLVFLK